MDGNSLFIPRRIALLAGGDSAEREISLASGQQVALALSQAGYEPVAIDPAASDLSAVDWSTFDVCFLALHGGAGEDGRIQQKLERWGVPYTGSGPTASRLAMSKSAAKMRFKKCGVPTLLWAVLSADEISADRNNTLGAIRGELERKLMPLGFPLVIKPESQGSSLGVCVAHGPNDVPRCLSISAQFDSSVLAETFVEGREFTISLLGRDPLPMIEIMAQQRLFTYDAKYINPTTEYRLDCNLAHEIEARMYRTAIEAVEALGTTGLVRVDLMLDQNDHPWILEVNTIPGMTERSLSPRAARAAGIEMSMLVDWMVRDAVLRRGSSVDAKRKRLADAASPKVATSGLKRLVEWGPP